MRYVICLPFRSDVELVPDNYEISLRRLPHLLKKLKNDPDLYQEYRRILDSYEKEGIIEKVSNPGIVGKTSYLPHRPVICKIKVVKLRRLE